jgi:soluble lytic murein transglycosylase-like protein
MDTSELKALIANYAQQHGLDPAIVYGVCVKESSLDPVQVRYEPSWMWFIDNHHGQPAACSDATERICQAISWGLMQVLGAVYRELGYVGWLSAIAADVDVQLEYGCRYLAKKIKRYGSLRSGLSAYNAGVPVDSNQASYVDKVLEYAKEWA